LVLLQELIIHIFVQTFNKHPISVERITVKNIITLFVFVLFAASTTASLAYSTGTRKATKSAVHKHHEKSSGCCTMEGADRSKNPDCCKMGSKNESSKTEKEELKKESEKK